MPLTNVARPTRWFDADHQGVWCCNTTHNYERSGFAFDFPIEEYEQAATSRAALSMRQRRRELIAKPFTSVISRPRPIDASF